MAQTSDHYGAGDETGSAAVEMTVDQLARHVQLPVRTIREYHTMRLLPPPERRGRVGFYGPGHVQRLQLIGRLQRRGYSLAGIRDLLQAWDAGTGLTAVLGIDAEPGVLDETPLWLSEAELAARFPPLTDERINEACAAGLIKPESDGYVVRSPALLALISDGTGEGVPFAAMLALAASVRRELSAAAPALAGVLAERLILPLLEAGRQPADIAPLMRRGRLLLIQGAASILTDQLGEALLARAARGDQAADGSSDQPAGSSGGALRAVIEQIRIGAVADAAGAIRHPAR